MATESVMANLSSKDDAMRRLTLAQIIQVACAFSLNHFSELCATYIAANGMDEYTITDLAAIKTAFDVIATSDAAKIFQVKLTEIGGEI